MGKADMKSNVATLQACAAQWAEAGRRPPVHDITNSYGLSEPSPGIGIYLVGVLPERIDRPMAEGLLIVAARRLTDDAPDSLRDRHEAGIVAAAVGECPLCGQIARTFVQSDGTARIVPLHYRGCPTHLEHHETVFLEATHD